MKARYLYLNPSEEILSKQQSFEKSQKKILYEEFFIKDSKILSTQTHTNVLSFQLYRTNKALSFIIAAFFFIVFGIICQRIVENFDNNRNNNENILKIPISSGLKIIESEQDPFEYMEREIQLIYNDELDYYQDLKLFINDSSYEANFENIKTFERKFTNHLKEYSDLKEGLNLTFDGNFDKLIEEFTQCSETLMLEKEVLNIKRIEIKHNYSELQTKLLDLNEIKNNNNEDEKKEDISKKLDQINEELAFEDIDDKILSERIEENAAHQIALTEKQNELSLLILNYTVQQQEQQFHLSRLEELMILKSNLFRDIEVLKLKIKDQIVISDISIILKQLGHDETLNKNQELIKILKSKISTLERSYKTHKLEEKKQILAKEQQKFKEIMRFLINIKKNAFQIQKNQINDYNEIQIFLISKEKELKHVVEDILFLQKEIAITENLLIFEEKTMRELKDEIERKIAVIEEILEFIEKHTIEWKLFKKTLKLKAQQLRNEEKNLNGEINFSKIKRESYQLEKNEVITEIKNLESIYFQSHKEFIEKLEKFQVDAAKCQKTEINLKESIRKNGDFLNQIKCEAKLVSQKEKELYSEINDFKLNIF